RQTEDKFESTQNQGVDRAFSSALQQMMSMQADMVAQIKIIQSKIDEVDKKQDYVNKAARRTLGEEYWNDQLRDILKGGIKSVLTQAIFMPMQLLNIVVFK